MNTLKWALGWLGKKRKVLIFAVFTGLLSIALMTIEPFLFRRIIDDVIIGGDRDALLPLLMRVLAIATGYLVLRYVTNMLCEVASQHVIVTMRRTLFDRILHQTVAFYRENAAGELITLCTGDTDMVRHFICWVIPRSIECAGMLIGVLAIFISINALYAVGLFILTPISGYIAFKLGKVILPAHTAVREQRAKLSTVVNENLNGNRVIKAFTREAFEVEKFEKENEEFKNTQINANYIWLKYQPIMEYMTQVLSIVNLVVGAIFVMNGLVTLGQMNIFFSLAWALNEPMMSMGTIINDAQRFVSSAEKLISLQYSRIHIESPEHPAPATAPRGEISMKNVSLEIGGALLLDGIDFSAAPGQTIGIMGPTGSGKTLLASLIPRMLDASGGEVRVDGADVRQYDLTELRGRIGMTTQDVFLFSDSAENNVAYGNPDASMREVEAAAEIADAAGFISKLPQGYDTTVGERGTGLSGGQKQRLSLARAVLPECSILIFDDTTSAVDMETEKAIQERLSAMETKATRLIIAQRVSSVKDADCIYILDKGRVSEKGTHAELMRLGGYYYETCMLQQPGESA